jgi:AcrR family transcriptional regulator
MEAVAECAGVTKVTLYARYPDKVTLLRAVMHERLEAWSDISKMRDNEQGETLDQRLRRYARLILRWSRVEEVRAFGKLLQGCWGIAQAVVDEMQAMRVSRMRDLIASDIVALDACEGPRPRDPLEIADLYLGMLRSFSAPAALSEDEAAPLIAAFSDRVVDILLHGRSAW